MFVVGDVHGDYDRLRALFSTLPEHGERLVMVGDYVNRGPRSREVLDLLLEQKDRLGDQLVLLEGNHEVALSDFLQGGPVEDFARHGGFATVSSYIDVRKWENPLETFRHCFPEEHSLLLESLNRYYWDANVFVSHAGFDVTSPTDLGSSALLNGDPRIFGHQGEWPSDTVVVGHFVQPNSEPHLDDHLVAIDLGCGSIPGAPLAAVRLPQRSIYRF